MAMDTSDISLKCTANIQMAEMERQFLKMYKQLSHLWNHNHPDYNNRYKRNEGYDILLPIFRQYMPQATRFHIRQKINILRSCYRKELRKYLASRTIDSDGKVMYSYIPQSWKFHTLRFLDCEEDGQNDTNESYPYYEEEQELEFIQDHDQDVDGESGNEDCNTSKINVSPIFIEEEKPRVRKRHWQTNHSWSGSEDNVLEREFNAIGTNVACKLLRMDAQQRYHAELLINKVLINGLKKRLTKETDLTERWHINDDNVSINSSINNSTNSHDDPIDTKPNS